MSDKCTMLASIIFNACRVVIASILSRIKVCVPNLSVVDLRFVRCGQVIKSNKTFKLSVKLH